MACFREQCHGRIWRCCADNASSRVFAVFVVLLGYGMLSLVFANIAAMFVGEEEKLLRREMHRDIKRLEGEICSMHDDLRALREELARGQSSCQASNTRR